MPEISPNARLSAMALAPTLQLRPQVVTPVVKMSHLNLSVIRNLVLADSLTNAPRVNSAPAGIDRAIAGADGTTYFVPQARIAERNKATRAPNVFLANNNGVVTLRVWFDLVRFASLPTGSQPLPVDNISVSLVPASGEPIRFEQCNDVLPTSDQPESLVSQLYCETPVDPNQVVAMLQEVGTHFRVEGDVHFATQDTATTPSPPTGSGRARLAGPTAPRIRTATPLRLNPAVTASIIKGLRAEPTRHRAPPASGRANQPTTPEPQWTSRTSRLALGEQGVVPACFPRDVRNNRMIYAQVTSGFGSEPWSEWVDSPNGTFMDSPIPDQFYVLPDEYRLAFDAETKEPATMVLLVPPKRAEGDESPMTFGGDYKLRTRFSVVPWVDPARRERLRAEITQHSGIPYPDLIIGGIRSATCELSAVLHELGSSLVGTEAAEVAVDGLGFDLVLDCTSEFYSTLTHMLVTDGVDAEVKATLVSDAEDPRVVSRPVSLRLDRPASDVLSAALVPPDVPDERATDAAAAPPTLRVSNPLPYAVTVAQTVASLLIVDETLPSPIGTVRATAHPSSFTLPPATDAPSTIDIALTPEPSDQPVAFGSVGASFVGIDIDIDPQQVLAKAHDTGTSGSVSSDIEVRSYQLEHPEYRPPELADVFGLEVQVRRSADATPVTVFLTVDQPKLEVQVSFSLRDIMAGARPEQPTFEWRRRNMRGSGTGDWSEWASITGRQLLVSPTGM